MKVRIPSALISYTGASEVDAHGADLLELLDDLDRQYPGFRFRVLDEQEALRPHMRFFVNGEQVFQIAHGLNPGDRIDLVQALSGG